MIADSLQGKEMTLTNCHTCVNCSIRKHSLLQGLSDGELTKLESRRKVLHVRRGQTIYEEGMQCFGLLCLSKGKAKVVRNMGHGREQIIALRKPVDFIGFRTLIQDRSYINTAIALEDSQVCVIHKDDFSDVVYANGQFSRRIMNMLAHELDDADRHAGILTGKHLRARLAETLLRVLDFFGTLPKEGNRLNVLLKRSDLASLSNMTTANVIRTLSAFCDEGLIRTELRKIWIDDLKALGAIARQTE